MGLDARMPAEYALDSGLAVRSLDPSRRRTAEEYACDELTEERRSTEGAKKPAVLLTGGRKIPYDLDSLFLNRLINANPPRPLARRRRVDGSGVAGMF